MGKPYLNVGGGEGLAVWSVISVIDIELIGGQHAEGHFNLQSETLLNLLDFLVYLAHNMGREMEIFFSTIGFERTNVESEPQNAIFIKEMGYNIFDLHEVYRPQSGLNFHGKSMLDAEFDTFFHLREG